LPLQRPTTIKVGSVGRQICLCFQNIFIKYQGPFPFNLLCWKISFIGFTSNVLFGTCFLYCLNTFNFVYTSKHEQNRTDFIDVNYRYIVFCQNIKYIIYYTKLWRLIFMALTVTLNISKIILRTFITSFWNGIILSIFNIVIWITEEKLLIVNSLQTIILH